MKNSGPEDANNLRTSSVQKPDLFSVNGFRYHCRWAVDVDYLRGLPEAERKWMQRFLSEYYDANNTLLRPEKHFAKCRECREGGDCGRRPPEKALHGTDDLRRECYRRQKASYFDAQSSGRVALWEDFNGVDTDGKVARRGSSGSMDVEALRPRIEAGDFADAHGDSKSTSTVVKRRPTRR